MLRGTVAAFAAGVGGAQAVTVAARSTRALGIPDALGRRNARNTSSLLVHEAHVARVTDPAGRLLRRRAADRRPRRTPAGRSCRASRPTAASRPPCGARTAGIWDRIRDEAHAARAAPGRHPPPPAHRVSASSRTSHEELPERRPLARPGADPLRRPLRTRLRGAAGRARRRRRSSSPRWDPWPSTPPARRSRRTCSRPVASTRWWPARPPRSRTLVKAYRASDPPSPVVCLAGSDASYAELGAEAAAELREAGATYVVLAGQARRQDGPRGRRRRQRRDRHRRAGLPPPRPRGARAMSVPDSFADLPLVGGTAPPTPPTRRPRWARRGSRPRASPSRRSTRPRTSRASTRSRPTPGSARSCAGPTRRCTRRSRGRSGSTPASRPPRSPTPSTAATSRPGRRGSRSPSTSRPTAATTPTTRACRATSAWPVSRSTRSTTPARSSTASRWTRCRCR